MRVVACALAVGVLLGGAARAEPLPQAGWKTLRVGVLPVESYVRGAEDLFVERPEVSALRQQAGEWLLKLERSVGHRDQVELVKAAQIKERLKRTDGYAEGVAIAAERFALGLDRYRALQVEKAMEQFAKAEVLYEDHLANVSEPRAVADLHLYKGLAHLEKGESNLGQIALRDMLVLDPQRQFSKGYYPANVEKALEGALVDLGMQADLVLIRYPLSRLVEIARRLQLDAVVVLLLTGRPDAPRLQLAVFDAATGGLALTETIPLASDPDPALEGVDRALSVWHTCALEAEAGRPFIRRPRRERFWLDIGYAHTLTLSHRRTRELFHSPGVAIGFTWEANQNLIVYGRAAQMAAIPDANEDLFETYVTSRFAGGVGISGGPTDLRFYAQIGLELALSFTDIFMTRDVDCKHFPRDSAEFEQLCSGLNPLEAPKAWFGLDFGLGLRWRFAGAFYLHFGVALASYVLESEVVGELNFPFSATLGIGNRF